MQKDIGDRTKSSLIWNTSLKVVFQIFKFVISIIIARILDPKDFGIMGLATMLIFYANSITNFGFNSALIQKKGINEDHINSVFTINIIISLFLTVVILLLSTQFARFFQVPELTHVFWALSSIFIITSFFQMPMVILKRQVNFKVVAFAEFYRGILHNLVTLILALLGFKYWSLVIGVIASYLFGTCYIFLKVKWRPRIKYNNNAMKDIFNFGMWNFIRSQIMNVNEYADKFIIGKFLGPVLLGFYEKAFSTVAVQKQGFTMHFNAVMFSSFSRIQSERNIKIRSYFRKALSMNALIIFPVCIGLFMLGTHFVLVLLGNKWQPMIMTLKILSVAFIFSSLNGLVTTLNMGLGDYVKHTLRVGACSLVLIVISLIAVQKGIEFVAIGVLFVYALIFFITFQIAKKRIGMYWEGLFESLMPAVVGSLIMVLMILFAERFLFHEVNFANLILLSGIGAITYLLAVFLPGYTVLEEFRKPVIIRIKEIFNMFKVSKSENL